MDWLRAIDANPVELQEALQSDRKVPLGKQFEAYIAFWLERSDYYDLQHKNVQLVGEKNTVGEIDFLFSERETGRNFHMEVACKFYLGYKNSANWEYWIGPNGNDTLRLKMDKLVKQLSITKTIEGARFLQENRVKTPEPVLLMKGMFFHHYKLIYRHKPPTFSNRNYHAGWWLHLSEGETFFQEGSSWAILRKSDWLATYHTDLNEDEIMSGAECYARCKSLIKEYKRSVMVVQVFPGGQGWEEASRGFVVPDKWPKR